jgi:hypothetical protein
MKKVFLLIMLFFCILNAYSQKEKSFEFNIGFGFTNYFSFHNSKYSNDYYINEYNRNTYDVKTYLYGEKLGFNIPFSFIFQVNEKYGIGFSFIQEVSFEPFTKEYITSDHSFYYKDQTSSFTKHGQSNRETDISENFIL